MNKTTTANIGGIVFHIDIDAYDTLQKYLSAIGRYFDKSEGKDEIMADIETRIAELLRERKSNPEQVVTMTDVKEVIAIMGEPEQYAEEGEEHFSEKHRSSYSYSRDRRRIFRDPDDRHIGGVCSGIGHYFGIDPVWIRLLFVIAFLGWGTGLLIYIILWIIIPEARTTAEKLEMRGEPVNIDNIGKTIDGEFNRVKEQFNAFAERTRKMDAKGNIQKLGDGIERLFHFLANILTQLFTAIWKVLVTVFRVVGKILGVALVIFGLVWLIILIASLSSSTTVLSITSEGFHYYSLHQLFGYITNNPTHWVLLLIAASLFIGIPLLALIYGGIKLLFPIQTGARSRGVGMTFFGLWLVGLIIAIILVIQIGSEFRNEARVTEEINLKPFSGKVLHIDVNKDLFLDELDETFDDKYIFQLKTADKNVELLRFDQLLFQHEDGEYFVGIPKLSIRKSASGSAYLKLSKYANGLTVRQAETTARSIRYHVEQSDSALVFDPIFEIRDEVIFRDQKLKIELMLPENTIIELSDATERLVYHYGNFSDEWLRESSDAWRWKMGGHKWIMLKDGLACIDCEDTSLNLLDSLQVELVRTVSW